MSKTLILKELSRYNIGTYADIIYRNALCVPTKRLLSTGQRGLPSQTLTTGVNSLVNALVSLGLKKGDGSVSYPGIVLECTDVSARR